MNSKIKVAVLADIHGNLPAFETALKHAAHLKPDLTLIAGDIVTGSPDSKDCLALAKSTGFPLLRGNHERYVAHFGTANASPLWTTDQFSPLQWAVAQFDDEERHSLGQFPAALRLSDLPGILFVHASERGDHDTIKPCTTEQALHDMFPAAQEPYIIRSHNHYAQVRIWQRGTIITTGSVGLPLDANPTAQYLLLERDAGHWTFHHQSVPYDHDAAIQRFHDTNYLAATGPMGRLFYRELVTAAQHIVPFLRLYQQWRAQEEISLDRAFERFTNL